MKTVKRKAKKKVEKPLENFIEAKYVEEEPLQNLQTMNIEEKLKYYFKQCSSAVDLKILNDCGAIISFLPSLQELYCDPDKFALCLLTQNAIGRGLTIMPGGGYIQNQVYEFIKPHLMGVGVREY